jgi:CubicO group peptidase (beta-lactamase class C family)
VDDLIATWPVAHASVAVITSAGTSFHGDPDRAYAWASVTKLVTALAVHIAHVEEELDLDEEWGPPGSTVRHLLAHASGLPFEGVEPLVPLASRRVYSNAGYDRLGDLLAERAGVPVAEVISRTVLGPLRMGGSRLDGRPSAGLVGSARDVAALGAELLAPSLLSPAAAGEMTSVAWPELDGVVPGFGLMRPCPWSLGAEVKGAKRPHWTSPHTSPATFGHFGAGGGFLWVDRAAGVACAGLTDEPFGAWAAEAWPILGTRVLIDAGAIEADLAGSGG